MHSKIIAITLDISRAIFSPKEGISIFAHFLAEGFLKSNPETKLEVWTFERNKEDVESFVSDLYKKYPGRIDVYTDESVKKRNHFQILFFDLVSIAALVCSFLCRILRLYSLQYRFNYVKELAQRGSIEAKNDIGKAFRMKSKADYCFVPFVKFKCAFQANVPTIVQVHDLFTMQFPKLFRGYMAPWTNVKVKGLLNRIAKKGACFVCSNSYTRRKQLLGNIRSVNENNSFVISFPPMIEDEMPSEDITKEAFKKKYSINTKYVTFPSQNRPNKNMATLLKAIDIVRSKGVDVKFVTTAEMAKLKDTGEFYQKHPDVAHEIGRIPRDDLYWLYKYSDAVVCPDIVEGMCISGQALEALKIGNIPVIHGKMYGIEDCLESVGLNYDSAPLNWFDLYDYEALAEIILDVLEDRDKHIEKQKHIIEKFMKKSWEDVANEYLKVFEQIAKEQNGKNTNC